MRVMSSPGSKFVFAVQEEQYLLGDVRIQLLHDFSKARVGERTVEAAVDANVGEDIVLGRKTGRVYRSPERGAYLRINVRQQLDLFGRLVRELEGNRHFVCR